MMIDANAAVTLLGNFSTRTPTGTKQKAKKKWI